MKERHFETLDGLSIKAKISLLSFVVALISCLAVFWVSTSTSKRELIALSQGQLQSVGEMAQKQIQSYFDRSKEFVIALGEDRLIEGLFLAYESAFYAAGYDVGKDIVMKESDLKNLNDKYTDRIGGYLKNYSLENILLVNIDGQVVFSALPDRNGKILGKNLLQGSLQNTKLSQCYKDSGKAMQGKPFFFDYEYVEEWKEAKSFICIKVLAEFPHLSEGISKGDLMGILIAEVGKTTINAVLGERTGMGETGQMYLVGSDMLLRSDFFLNRETYNTDNSIGKKIKVSSNGAIEATQGKAGFVFSMSPLDDYVAMAYYPLEVFGHKWGLIAEKSESEILKPLNEMMIKSLLAMVAILLSVIGISIFLGSIFSKPLVSLGDKLSESARTLMSSSEELNHSASKLSESASQQAAAVEQSKVGLTRLKESSERNLKDAKVSQEITAEVTTEISNANHRMKDLVLAMGSIKSSFDRIDHMVEVIREVAVKTEVMNSIAYKTQILSFNASIEATRAGAAGRGFSVVAQEVGQLAEMSSKAATEIEEAIKTTVVQVEALTQSAKESVDKGEELVGSTSDLLDLIVAKTDSVQESSKSIYFSSTEQTSGISEVNVAMEQILEAVTNAERDSLEAKDNSGRLADQSSQLGEVSQNMFRIIYGKAE